MERLVGPTGIRINRQTKWVHGYFRGVLTAGLSFAEALTWSDGGVRWLLTQTAWNWGQCVADAIGSSGAPLDET